MPTSPRQKQLANDNCEMSTGMANCIIGNESQYICICMTHLRVTYMKHNHNQLIRIMNKGLTIIEVFHNASSKFDFLNHFSTKCSLQYVSL